VGPVFAHQNQGLLSQYENGYHNFGMEDNIKIVSREVECEGMDSIQVQNNV
jgi:hypothetical protein